MKLENESDLRNVTEVCGFLDVLQDNLVRFKFDFETQILAGNSNVF